LSSLDKAQLPPKIESTLEEVLPTQHKVQNFREKHALLLASLALQEEDPEAHRTILISFFDDVSNDGGEPLADQKATAALIGSHLRWLVRVSFAPVGSKFVQSVLDAVDEEGCSEGDASATWKEKSTCLDMMPGHELSLLLCTNKLLTCILSTVSQELGSIIGRHIRRISSKVAERLIKLLDQEQGDSLTRDHIAALLELSNFSSNGMDATASALFALIDADQSAGVEKKEVQDFFREFMICLIELSHVIVDVFHVALFLPMAHTALGSAISQLDGDNSGHVDIHEANAFLAQIMEGSGGGSKSEAAVNFFRGGHLREEEVSGILKMLNETQMLGMIVGLSIKEAGVTGLDQDDFEDLTVDMLENQIDLILSLIPTIVLNSPESQQNLPSWLSTIKDPLSSLKEEFRGHCTEQQDMLVSTYFEFLDSDGSGSLTSSEFCAALKILDPKIDFERKVRPQP